MTNEGVWAVGSICLAATLSVIAMSVSYAKANAPAHTTVVQELVLDDEVEIKIMAIKELLRECRNFNYTSERDECIEGVFEVFKDDSEFMVFMGD